MKKHRITRREREVKFSSFFFFSFLAVSFRGQNLLKARPDGAPLGVKFKISDEHPRLFHIGVPPPFREQNQDSRQHVQDG